MIEAKIVKDSIAPSERRLTTFVLTYPRFIHAEFMTHRMFSRNASSSRAIPVKKSIQMVIDNPAIPLAFTKNQKGMQGGEALDGKAHELAVRTWLHARDHAVAMATMLADLEVHKQYANRILEPFSHITVVCSATEFANFFALRYHSMAQPEICQLAKQMWEEYSKSTPTFLLSSQWHLPFVGLGSHSVEEGIRMSVARCARVSYLNHEGKVPSKEEDFQLYDRLVGNAPIHASPAEHQACAERDPDIRSGNFIGWTQYRKALANENVEKFDGPSDN
jgi:thymidylate synthase ThyX